MSDFADVTVTRDQADLLHARQQARAAADLLRAALLTDDRSARRELIRDALGTLCSVEGVKVTRPGR